MDIKQLRPEASSSPIRNRPTAEGGAEGGAEESPSKRTRGGVKEAGASKSPSKAKKLADAKETSKEKKIAADHLELASRYPLDTEVWVFARQTVEDDALTVWLKDDKYITPNGNLTSDAPLLAGRVIDNVQGAECQHFSSRTLMPLPPKFLRLEIPKANSRSPVGTDEFATKAITAFRDLPN
ncbi:hypothetical protein CYMTET_20087 [Cymbomonas tetramitiformis]|uniref:Uncharacterized protein n=1 Tax=Cymbomonas tetramitiformis TaxID=36881 RepID=A0AAE0L487_9CHLO|nr:hypothetical protein CYMTET_20087 [Cymbomonas tetramitiformis]